MSDRLPISDVVFTAADSTAQRSGLLGYVRCRFANALVLDSIAVRRTEDGRRTLSFPSRTDGQGGKHPIYRPLDDRTRRAIEAAIFEALGIHAEEDADGR